MINFFEKLYTSIESKNELLDRIRFYSFLRFLVRLTVNIILPIYYNLTKNNIKYRLTEERNDNIKLIVSLTSFPVRIGRLWVVIETIFRQNQKPNKIILWLSKEQFSSFDVLPRKLLKQCSRGLDIRLVDENIRSHKKYFYTLTEYPKDYMLTIDDDIFYRSTMIEDLYSYSLKYPNCVISQYSCEMSWKASKLDSHLLWKHNILEKGPNLNTFFGSGGGTLFPPLSLYSKTLDRELFLSLTPTADDVWLNAMCRMNKTKVVVTKYNLRYIPILNFLNKTLYSINNGLYQNDKQIEAVQEYFMNYEGIDPFSKMVE